MYNWSNKLLKVEKNSINDVFFSDDKIKYINRQLIIETFNQTKIIIDKQNLNDILIIMQYFYNETTHKCVDELNRLVLDDLVSQTISGVRHHLFYLKNLNKNVEPLNYGISTS